MRAMKLRIRAVVLCALLAAASVTFLHAQDSGSSPDLAARIERMQKQIDAQQQTLDEYRSALKALQQQVQAGAPQNAPQAANACTVPPASSEPNASSLQQAVADIREEQSVQQAEIAVHEQSKVETPSRYKLKIGGLVLFNAFANDGAVDNTEVPAIALPRTTGESNGSLGATVRQSMITLGASGPEVWGAHTYADVQMDFFGGLSTSDYTSTAGTVRMRTASMQLVWPSVTVHAGLERLIIAPSSPTSYASLAEPALAWSGNLWAWVPQIAAEKTFSLGDRQSLSLAAAFVDVPDPGPSSNSYDRAPTAAESSRYPGSEGRVGYAWGRDRASGIGVSGYFSPHSYGTYGSVDAWAGLTDWHISLPAHFWFSGEAYKGQALGGLGGGAYKDVVNAYAYETGHVPYAKVIGLRNDGGWAQIKFHPANILEFNGVFGEDEGSAAQLRKSAVALTDPYSGLVRNRTFFGNVIFRPRSSFLLSLEYRKIMSWQLLSPANQAQIVGLAAGFEF
jgi:uncharacterized coiled-coil protein SlyX